MGQYNEAQFSPQQFEPGEWMKNDVSLEMLGIVGKRLCLTRRSLDIRQFHFGDLRRDGDKSWGEWALHTSCP